MSTRKSTAAVAKASVVIRQDPKTGKHMEGVLIWTPYSKSLDPQLIYCPDATERISKPDEPVSPNTKMPVCGCCDTPRLKASKSAAPLSQVCRYYTGGCDGGDPYPDNCAHYLSNAFIRAGYSDLLTSPVITERCKSGSKRAIRAYDMLRWFQSRQARFRSGVIPRGNGVWVTYQEKPGWKHVLISNTDDWTYCGTGDYPDWPTQWNYQW